MLSNRDIKNIRKQFPILGTKMNGSVLSYFDSAATSQKPQCVIDSVVDYYSTYNANIHRSSYSIAELATERWKGAHDIVARFLNADSYEEIVFVRNCTEGLNLIAQSYGRENLKEGDIVVVSEMEHHSNLVPWQILQKEIGFEIKFIPVNDGYDLDLDWLEKLIDKERDRVKIVSVVHISNVLGTRNDVKKIADIAHRVDALMVVDAAQSVPHMKVDVKDLDCDVLVFSGHKVFAPTGSGALYCKKGILKRLSPVMGGGEMISSVSKESFELNDLPWRFEAGTPNIAGGIALGVALDWYMDLIDSVGGWNVVEVHERELMDTFFDCFDGVDWLKVFGKEKDRYGVVAFGLEGFTFKGCKELGGKKKEGEGIVEFLNKRGFALREGYHCAEPLHDRFDFGPTLRASFAIYNTKEEVIKLANTIKEAVLSSY
jgi:cysteine desulfurase/selenocysteine lyase